MSESQKSRPNENVSRFLKSLSPRTAYVSVFSFGELRRGIAIRSKKDVRAAESLSRWVDHLEREFSSCVLGVDRAVARLWGELSADRTRPFVDMLLAATAIHHGLTLVTRNVRDVQDTPVALLNPWMD